MILLVGIGLFTSREVLRILGVEDFGTYNLVGTIVVMFTFLQAALNNATSRFITFDLGAGVKDNLRKTFSMSLNSEFVLAGFILVISELFGPWFIGCYLKIPEGRIAAAQAVYQISLINFLITLIRTPFNSLIIAHEKMDYYAYTSIIEGVLKLVIVYILTIIEYDKLIIYAWLQVGVSAFIFIWMMLFCRRNFEECRYIKYWDNRLLKKLLSYSGLSLLVNICDIAVVQSIGIFFNMFSGVVANAAMGVANQVNTQLNQFLNNFSQSYNPQIIKSYAAQKFDYFIDLIFTSSKLSFFLLFGLSFPILLNIPYILNIWLVNPPQNAGLFLRLIAVYSLIDSFSAPLWIAVHATGNLKVHQILMATIKILNIPLSYTLLKMGFPVAVVLVVYVLLNFVCAVVRIWWMKYLIHMNIKAYLQSVLWQIVKVIVISIPIPIFFSSIILNEILGLVISSISFFIIYCTIIYLSALNIKERELVCSLVIKIKNRFIKKTC